MQGNPMLLSIVIPVYNKWDLTRQCLASLAASADCDDYEVIVVDNASTDATVEACAPTGKALFGQRFLTLRQESNRNFSGACNVGAAAATSDHLFFLNNDTILQPGWRLPLHAALRATPKLGAVGPVLTYPECDGFRNRVQHLGVTFGPSMQVSHLYEFFPATHPLVDKTRSFQAITAAALFMSAKLFAQVGGFDEAFVNGFEDLDLCARLVSQGLCMTCVPDARIHHLCGQTPGRGAHDEANSRLLTTKAHTIFTQDKLALVEADGYNLRLTPWLTYEVEVTQKNAALLRSRLRHMHEPAEFAAMMEEEPYFIDTYAALGTMLEKHGRCEEALGVRLWGTRFRDTPETLLPLWLAAQRLGVEMQFPALRAKLVTYASLPRDERIRTMRQLRRQYKTVSASLYADAVDFLGHEEQFFQSVIVPLQAALR